MPNCVKCGQVYNFWTETGLCDPCASKATGRRASAGETSPPSEAFAWGKVCAGLSLVSLGPVLSLTSLGLSLLPQIQYPDVPSDLLGALLAVLLFGGPILTVVGICLCGAAPAASGTKVWINACYYLLGTNAALLFLAGAAEVRHQREVMQWQKAQAESGPGEPVGQLPSPWWVGWVSTMKIAARALGLFTLLCLGLFFRGVAVHFQSKWLAWSALVFLSVLALFGVIAGVGSWLEGERFGRGDNLLTGAAMVGGVVIFLWVPLQAFLLRRRITHSVLLGNP